MRQSIQPVAGGPTAPGAVRREVRAARLLQIVLAETPIPCARELAQRLGVSEPTVLRDLSGEAFGRMLDEALRAELSRVLAETVGTHVAVMRDPEATAAERMAAARWIHARWAACQRARERLRLRPELPSAQASGKVADMESELLDQVMRETAAAREAARPQG